MMQSNFKIVFKVETSHTYFEKNSCNCLHFEPGPVTKSLIKRFGLVIAKQVNGFEFYANPVNAVSLLLNYIKAATGATFFDFDIRWDDANFSHFTELPLNWVGQLVYDSHSAANINNAGVIQLAESFSDSAGTPYNGSLTIHFDDILKGDTQFSINYTARATQWQYFVVNKSAVPLSNPAVTGKTSIVFNSPENVTMENGDQALLFTSGDNLISLSQVPKYKFDLVNYTSGATNDAAQRASPKVIVKGLPNPGAQQISIAKGDKGQVSSPMYVYI